MRSLPVFMRGAYKSRFHSREPAKPTQHTTSSVCAAWKLFLLVPRSSRASEQVRAICQASTAGSRRSLTWVDSVERRAERAQVLVVLGEISAGRAALETVFSGTASAVRTTRSRHRPNWMAAEHLRNLLDSTRDSDLLWERHSFAQGRVPAELIPHLRFSGQNHCCAENIWRDPRYCGGRFQASGGAHTIERSR